MLGSEYDYFDNWEAGGDFDSFKKTCQKKRFIRGCLETEKGWSRRCGVTKTISKPLIGSNVSTTGKKTPIPIFIKKSDTAKCHTESPSNYSTNPRKREGHHHFIITPDSKSAKHSGPKC